MDEVAITIRDLIRARSHTTRVPAADDFNAVERISSALTSSERLAAAPREPLIACGWRSSTLNVSAVTIASPCHWTCEANSDLLQLRGKGIQMWWPFGCREKTCRARTSAASFCRAAA